MLRLNPSQPPPSFSLDKRHLAQRRGMKKREWRLVLMLPFALVAIGVVINVLLGYTKMIPHGPLEPVIEEPALAPMPGPRLSDAPALPEQTAITAEIAIVHELIADRATVRHEDVLDALTLAWAQELLTADRAAPPIPQHALARDLLMGGVRPGAAITLHGRLLDSIPAPIAGAATGYQRLSIQMDELQIAQVLAPETAATLVIGRDVQVLGRFLGTAAVPSGTAGDTQMPLIIARNVRASEQTTDPGDDDLAEMRGLIPKQLPDDLYTNVGDERSILETRPYYFLLGQARVDRDGEATVYDHAPSGNLTADDIHQKPDSFRGKPFTITGYVYRGWEDSNVARDQPFGVTRVVRLLLWNRDFGKVTEDIDGKPTIKSQILRLYEACLVTDQPLPERGAKIIVNSRFFKFRAIPVTPSSLRDKRNQVQRQSDNVYPFVFVGSGYTFEAPPPMYTFSWMDTIIAACCIGLGILMLVLVRRDLRLEGLVGAQIRKFRATRQALAQARKIGGKPVAQTDTAADRPAGESGAATSPTTVPEP